MWLIKLSPTQMVDNFKQGLPKTGEQKTNQESRLSCRKNLGGDRLPVNCEVGPGEERYRCIFSGQKASGRKSWSAMESLRKGNATMPYFQLSTLHIFFLSFSWLLHISLFWTETCSGPSFSWPGSRFPHRHLGWSGVCNLLLMDKILHQVGYMRGQNLSINRIKPYQPSR